MSQELITTDAQPEHSSIMGGSTCERRIMCLGSCRMEREALAKAGGVIEDENEYSKEGTALHHAMEHLLNSIEGLIPTLSEIDAIFGMTFNGVEMTPELMDNKIIPALSAFEHIIEKYDIVDYIVEVRGDIPDAPGAFGTIDILGVTREGEMVVLDWKFGDGIFVDAEGSYQLQFYEACAYYSNSDDIVDFLYEDPDTILADKIILGIIQPRRNRDEETYRVWETDVDALEAFTARVVDAVEKGKDPNAPLRAGKWCWKCKAELICPERNKDIMAVDYVKPALMSPLDISQNLEIADKVEGWIKTLRDYAHKEAERGVKIPGYKLVMKRGTRIYADKEAAERKLVRKLKMAGAYEKKLISPAQAEIKLGKKDFQKLLGAIVVNHSSGTTLVAETDKRPEVSQLDKLKDLEEQKGIPSIFDEK